MSAENDAAGRGGGADSPPGPGWRWPAEGWRAQGGEPPRVESLAAPALTLRAADGDWPAGAALARALVSQPPQIVAAAGAGPLAAAQVLSLALGGFATECQSFRFVDLAPNALQAIPAGTTGEHCLGSAPAASLSTPRRGRLAAAAGAPLTAHAEPGADSRGAERWGAETANAAPCRGGRGPMADSPENYTRLTAPADVVKLSDRLHYLLEPPLEVWLARSELALPAAPFAYQWEGVAFLYPRTAAVLADEMGLGKTMQAITAFRLLLHSGEARSVLLVCPKPLVSNWRRELAHWAPELPVAVIEGDPARRRWQWGLSDTPVKIANYELLLRDREVFSQPHLRFDLVVLDESQRIKNAASATAQVVHEIARRRSWALTGTPVENSAADLVGIFEFLAPGYLSKEMKLRHLGRLAGDYVLRRTKDRVLADLPPKLFRDAELELAPEQRRSYQLAEEKGVLRLTELGDGVTIQHVFELILRLKQICNFDPATGQSAKLERLEADLEEVAASGRKAIVFSQYVETLESLAARLARYRPLVFHGRVPPRRREGVLAQFRQRRGSTVLLLSYGAGGVGLNLQCAGYVFLFDRWWNPAIEDQAINRAHRIGVDGPVTVSRYLTLDTIEERIEQILSQKREIFEIIFSGHSPQGQLGMSREQIFSLFNLRTPGATGQRAA